MAFCFASVFGAMTGPISILPNETNSTDFLENITDIGDDGGDQVSYGSDDVQNDDSSNNDQSSDGSDSQQSQDDEPTPAPTPEPDPEPQNVIIESGPNGA